MLTGKACFFFVVFFASFREKRKTGHKRDLFQPSAQHLHVQATIKITLFIDGSTVHLKALIKLSRV